MKRHGNLFAKITDPDNLYAAYRAARKSKSNHHCVREFEQNEDANLAVIRELLLTKTYSTSTYKEKVIYEPKQRTIYVLPFAPDRIVQHALMQVLEPIWDRLMIADSYACRKNKGIHLASQRTMEFVRQNAWYLQCDISKFYPSIHHDTMMEIVERKIKCKDTLWLLRNIIYSIPGGVNVPIGNYTSQWLGNLYLNELDQLLKQRYRVRHYLRYCDDFILFDNDKGRLRELAGVITDFCRARLRMRLSKCSLQPTSHGVDFVGYRHFRNYILLRKATAKRMRKRLKALPWLYRHKRITADQYRSSVASIGGWLKWANTHNLKLAIDFRRMQKEVAIL